MDSKHPHDARHDFHSVGAKLPFAVSLFGLASLVAPPQVLLPATCFMLSLFSTSHFADVVSATVDVQRAYPTPVREPFLDHLFTDFLVGGVATLPALSLFAVLLHAIAVLFTSSLGRVTAFPALFIGGEQVPSRDVRRSVPASRVHAVFYFMYTVLFFAIAVCDLHPVQLRTGSVGGTATFFGIVAFVCGAYETRRPAQFRSILISIRDRAMPFAFALFVVLLQVLLIPVLKHAIGVIPCAGFTCPFGTVLNPFATNDNERCDVIGKPFAPSTPNTQPLCDVTNMPWDLINATKTSRLSSALQIECNLNGSYGLFRSSAILSLVHWCLVTAIVTSLAALVSNTLRHSFDVRTHLRKLESDDSLSDDNPKSLLWLKWLFLHRRIPFAASLLPFQGNKPLTFAWLLWYPFCIAVASELVTPIYPIWGHVLVWMCHCTATGILWINKPFANAMVQRLAWHVALISAMNALVALIGATLRLETALESSAFGFFAGCVAAGNFVPIARFITVACSKNGNKAEWAAPQPRVLQPLLPKRSSPKPSDASSRRSIFTGLLPSQDFVDADCDQGETDEGDSESSRGLPQWRVLVALLAVSTAFFGCSAAAMAQHATVFAYNTETASVTLSAGYVPSATLAPIDALSYAPFLSTGVARSVRARLFPFLLKEDHVLNHRTPLPFSQQSLNLWNVQSSCCFVSQFPGPEGGVVERWLLNISSSGNTKIPQYFVVSHSRSNDIDANNGAFYRPLCATAFEQNASRIDVARRTWRQAALTGLTSNVQCALNVNTSVPESPLLFASCPRPSGITEDAWKFMW